MLIAQSINYDDLDALNSQLALFFWGGLLFCLLVLCGLYFFAWWVFNRPDARSPYSKKKMARGSDLTFEAVSHIQDFLEAQGMAMFDPQKAAVCRQTGRIFPDALNIFGSIKIPKTYLKRKYAGAFVSWGSLSKLEQEKILSVYTESKKVLEGFQTVYSCKEELPWNTKSAYLLEKPGPLYVDKQSNALLGWKCVPASNLEVLILKSPL